MPIQNWSPYTNDVPKCLWGYGLCLQNPKHVTDVRATKYNEISISSETSPTAFYTHLPNSSVAQLSHFKSSKNSCIAPSGGLHHHSGLDEEICSTMQQPTAQLFPCPASCPVPKRCPCPPPWHSVLLRGVSSIPQGCQRERHTPFPREKREILELKFR